MGTTFFIRLFYMNIAILDCIASLANMLMFTSAFGIIANISFKWLPHRKVFPHPLRGELNYKNVAL